jgi:Flp pilus assembly protein TadD
VPNDPLLLNNLAVALRSARRLDEAAALLRTAATALPNDAQIALNLGITLRTALKYEEAIPEYQRALRLAPMNTDAMFDLAACYEQLHRSDEAIRAYGTYIEAIRARDPAAATRAQERIQAVRGQ